MRRYVLYSLVCMTVIVEITFWFYIRKYSNTIMTKVNIWQQHEYISIATPKRPKD